MTTALAAVAVWFFTPWIVFALVFCGVMAKQFLAGVFTKQHRYAAVIDGEGMSVEELYEKAKYLTRSKDHPITNPGPSEAAKRLAAGFEHLARAAKKTTFTVADSAAAFQVGDYIKDTATGYAGEIVSIDHGTEIHIRDNGKTGAQNNFGEMRGPAIINEDWRVEFTMEALPDYMAASDEPGHVPTFAETMDKLRENHAVEIDTYGIGGPDRLSHIQATIHCSSGDEAQGIHDKLIAGEFPGVHGVTEVRVICNRDHAKF